jgi:hypothetical protein
MSTVPEAIVARQCGLRVAGISCITNLAAGISRDKLSHADVLKTAGRVEVTAAQLLSHFSKLYRDQFNNTRLSIKTCFRIGFYTKGTVPRDG